MEDERAPRLAIVIGGLMLVMLLASLDQTIVSTALPTIVGDLGGLEHLSWVVTAYLLAITVVTPLYGKLGDQLGRKSCCRARSWSSSSARRCAGWRSRCRSSSPSARCRASAAAG